MLLLQPQISSNSQGTMISYHEDMGDTLTRPLWPSGKEHLLVFNVSVKRKDDGLLIRSRTRAPAGPPSWVTVERERLEWKKRRYIYDYKQTPSNIQISRYNNDI
ncbi:unnamed protein product [Angiostrongylus costaricensis]|uniref:F5/8 type C domain-containing protein n=1 Tax=Angiostrongylus costaricensis TaxID=334426 RepID=A0A0R3PDE8_ANGCS|nr:unnamed protein product [Angiostrongylus costaricensis]